MNQLSFRFESLIEHPITNQNPTVTAERPDFEFTIDDWNLLSDWGVVEPSTCEIFSFDVGLFSGSFQDDGVGEDFMPNDSNSATVSLEVCAGPISAIIPSTNMKAAFGRIYDEGAGDFGANSAILASLIVRMRRPPV